CDLIARAYERLAAAGAELVLTPELAITGYPPQDLVLKSRFVPENLELLAKLDARVGDAALLVGFVDRNEGRGKPFRNAAALLERGKPIRKTYKSLLPTYDVFDEERYFQPAESVEPFVVHGKKIGVTICEDIWTEHYLPRPLYDVEPVRALVDQGAELIVNLSASPFALHKAAVRYEMVATLAQTYRRAICYCNAVGGNDQLIFDGNSIAVKAIGPENVVGVSMPSQYSSGGSIDDSKQLAKNLGIKLLHIPIAETFSLFKAQFKEIFSGLPENETEENMQPRLRAMTLMA